MNKKSILTGVALAFAGLLGVASHQADAQAEGLMSQRVSSPPVIDGVAEATWDNIPSVSLAAVGGANTGSSDVTLKSVYSGDRVYFLVQWTDPTESTRRFPWVKQEDGSWLQLNDGSDHDETEYYEDKFAFIWNIDNSISGFNEGGCMVTCHVGEPNKSYGNKYAPGASEMGDIWHWKGVRSNPLGYIDDQYLDGTQWSADTPSAGRHSDPRDGGSYVNNKNEAGDAPAFSGPEGANGSYWIVDEEKVEFVDTFSSGDELPGIILSRPTGDRGDISAKGVYSNGGWTLEISRALVTGSDVDVQFDNLNATYYFGVAPFDNAQVRHAYQTGVTALTFETADYVGHDACKGCHSSVYAEYIQSGHSYKLNKVVNGQAPTYPHSVVPSPPEGYTWDDVTYVIGGFGWKARFLDLNGYIITGDAVQWTLETQTWSGYHADEAVGTKPYNCGTCHTTGWQTLEENGGVHQDGLEGMAGTFAAPGVECEGCHGPGGDHVGGPSKTNIQKDTTKEMCGSCHFRDSGHRIAASGGLIKHHEQYDELVNSPHEFMECGQCHDPHKSTKYELGGVTEGADCIKCHGDVEIKVAGMADHSCESCHMPKATKSAVKTAEFDKEDDTGFLGDISSHTFKINTNPDAMMFTADGKFVELDAEGHAIVTADFACAACHGKDGIASEQTAAWMFANAAIVHTSGQLVDTGEERVLASLPTKGRGLTISGAVAGGRRMRLRGSQPNPFNSSTMINYEIIEASPVRLEVFDMTGQKVRTLVNFTQEPGSYQIMWNGRDADGRELATGTYLYRLQAGAEVLREKMTLLK